MDIDVTDLDLGYTQCADLNGLATRDGEKLISDLSDNISNLKLHWIGSDANVHINNLITVYDALISIVTSAKQISSLAGSKMSDLQKVRQSNGGLGTPGSDLPSNAPDAAPIAAPAETSEYNCKPAATTDHDDLGRICESFDKFKTNFKDGKDKLLSNWNAGCGRENAKLTLDSFVENTDTYSSHLKNAKEQLGLAIENISKVNQ